MNSHHRDVKQHPRRPRFGWVHAITTTAVVVLAIAVYHFQQLPTVPLQRDTPSPPAAPMHRAAPLPAAGKAGEKGVAATAETSGKTERRDSRDNGRHAKDSDAENRIQAILALKRAGDEAWRDALREFIETHPNYPLPDELQR